LIRSIALIVGLLLAGGCSAGPVTAPSSGAPTASSVPVPVAEPTAVTIPKIGAHSSLIRIGLTGVTEDCPTGDCLDVPPTDRPLQAGWYAGRDPEFSGDEVTPGEIGPAVIAGHVDGEIGGRKGQPGIFYRLHELAPGDEVLVDRDGQRQLRFVVTAVRRYSKAAFPTEEVYGRTDGPELRLITCGGPFNRSAGHYEDNVIVWAVLA
jgi:hypothetical protein